MQNIQQNALTTDEINAIARSIDKGTVNPNDLFRIFNWLQSIQNDLQSGPVSYTLRDVKSGNFPSLPPEKVAFLYLESATYEGTVIAGVDKWRRLYDGATFDIGAAIP
jgi:hypothetical protein